ncbi:unnamed protein product [uncultured bacterium]|nr:unnamed protein product [uncultured bacterium]
MNSRTKNSYESIRGAVEFCTLNPTQITTGSEIGKLVESLKLNLSTLDHNGMAAIQGNSDFRGGTRSKKEIQTELLESLDGLRACAVTLADSHPELLGQFRLPTSRSHVALLHTAQTANEAIPPVKQALLACELPTDFDSVFAGLVLEYANAIDTQRSGRAKRVGGNAALRSLASQGLEMIDKLNGLFRSKFRTQPGLWNAWLSAAHLQRPPKRSKAAAAPVSAEAPAPAASAPAPIAK